MIYNKNERKPQIWFCGAHFINDIYTGFLNPIMPFIAEQVKISMPIATIILSCSHIFSSLLQPYFGFFADKMKKKSLNFLGINFYCNIYITCSGIKKYCTYDIIYHLRKYRIELVSPSIIGVGIKIHNIRCG